MKCKREGRVQLDKKKGTSNDRPNVLGEPPWARKKERIMLYCIVCMLRIVTSRDGWDCWELLKEVQYQTDFSDCGI